jgi:hypothetical protein
MIEEERFTANPQLATATAAIRGIQMCICVEWSRDSGEQ